MNTNVRDLSDPQLWERSLARARHRRYLFEMGRRHARRRKATSVALAGAVAAAPATPLLPVAAAHAPDVAGGAPAPRDGTILLERGSTGDAVAQVQARIGVDDDGIFGPITERAVRRFQATHGLAVTGAVDAATWAAIFRSKVVFLRDSSTPRPAPPASAPRGGGAAERDTRRLDADLLRDAAPAPRPAAPVAVLSDDCSTVTPVRGVRTGSFGESRSGRRHAGVDIAAPSGTPVKAAACGRVVQAGAQGGYGNLVCIEHAGGTTTCYAHLSRIDTRLRQWVESGQVIGTVGSTGNSTGPHLHFEVRENGRPVDPSGYVNGTRSLPRGEGATGGSHPRATRATTSTHSATSSWGTTTPDSSRGSWSGGEPAPEPRATSEQPAPAPPPAEHPTPAPTPAEQPAPTPPPAPAAEAQPAPTPPPAPAPVEQAAPVEEAAPAPPPADEAAPELGADEPAPVAEAGPAEEAAPAA